MTKATQQVEQLSHKQTTTRKNTATKSSDQLSAYFRDLSEYNLLDAKEELQIAQSIEDHEVRTWSILLSFSPTVDHLLGILEARIENSLTSFRALRIVANTARQTPTKRNQSKLDQAAQATATELRSLDPDRTHLDALLAELKTIATQSDHAFAQTADFSTFHDNVMLEYRYASQLRDEFVRANLRLVVTMARRYDRGGMPLSDLIQEGNLGLIHAVSRFDYRRGLRFSTYACWWIRHAIGRALADKSRTVRVPVHMIEAQQQLAKIRQRLIVKLGRDPTHAELAKNAEVSISKLNQMNLFLLGKPVSLDSPHHAEDGRTLAETLPDPQTEDLTQADVLANQTLNLQIRSLMEHLSPIEADVLRQRFGLADDQERTFREIGSQYKLSRERIRQIQNTALKKLRRALERAS